MRLTTRVAARRGRRDVLRRRLSLNGLPDVEAVPAEFVCGADLIREAVCIEPALLLGAPTAVPRELDRLRFARAFDGDRSHEIGTAGARIDVESLDRPLGVRVEDLIDEAKHLDTRDDTRVGDRGRVEARREREDVSLEAICGGRLRKKLGIYGHERNISRGAPDAVACAVFHLTKLTGESAQPFVS